METDPTLELYKLEYERCAIRYEDIYKAIWTNFSYLSVVAGAILTFGSTHLNINLAAFIACFPLLFWYWATYLPLDRYGNDALNRLRAIEGILNDKYETKLNHYTGFLESKTSGHAQANPSPVRIRAKYTIKIFFFLLHIIAIILLHELYKNLPLSFILGGILYWIYIGTHVERPRWSLQGASKALLILVAGGGIILLLITTPMPKREKKVKKMIVTNKEGVIAVKPEEKGDETFVIQLDGFDGVVLK